MTGSIVKQGIDLASELAEPLLDSHLAAGWLHDVPLLGAAIRAVRLSKSVSDAILAAKIRRFIDGVGEVDPEDAINFTYDLRRDPELRTRVGRLVVLTIDRTDDLYKAQLIGLVFRAFIQRLVRLSELQSLTAAIDRATATDLEEFLSSVHSGADPELLRRLMPSGLAELARSIGAPLSGRAQADVPIIPQLADIGALLRRIAGRV